MTVLSFPAMAFDLRLIAHDIAASAASVEDLIIQLELAVEDDTHEPVRLAGCRAALSDLHRRAAIAGDLSALLIELAPHEGRVRDLLNGDAAHAEDRAFTTRLKDQLLDFVRRRGRRQSDRWPGFCALRRQIGRMDLSARGR